MLPRDELGGFRVARNMALEGMSKLEVVELTTILRSLQVMVGICV